MIGIFNGASFGTLFETSDGRKAVYLKHVVYNDSHVCMLEGFSNSIIFNNDGRRKGGGRFVSRLGSDLDIVKRLN